MTSATKKSSTASTEKKSSSRPITPKVIKKTVKQAKSVAKHGVMTKSVVTQDVMNSICDRLALGESLRKICLSSSMPAMSTIFLELAKNETFSDQYARAREAQADVFAADTVDIADDGSNDTYETEDGTRTNQDVIARSRLRVDARKWLASKMAPKKYGDKQTIDLNAKVEMSEAAIDEKLARLLSNTK